MPSEPSEADVIFNRVSVELAKHQRTVASWLPPKSAEELANVRTEEQLQQDEKELFTPVPELLGVGAPTPKDLTDGTLKRRGLSSDDKLLEQLLGRKAAKAHIASKQQARQSAQLQKAGAKSSKVAKLPEDSEDEEEGRAAAFKSRKQKKKCPERKIAEQDVEAEEESVQGPSALAGASSADSEEATPTLDADTSDTKRKRELEDQDEVIEEVQQAEPHREMPRKPVSFLDEMLAERANKKKKKKRNKDQSS